MAVSNSTSTPAPRTIYQHINGLEHGAMAELLQSVGEVQAPDLCNGPIAATLQQFRYLTTESVVIEQQTADK
jgi:hypothetical protein